MSTSHLLSPKRIRHPRYRSDDVDLASDVRFELERRRRETARMSPRQLEQAHYRRGRRRNSKQHPRYRRTRSHVVEL